MSEGEVARSVDAASPVTAKAPAQKDTKGAARRILELPLLVALAIIVAVVIKTFLVQAFYIPSASMVPTLRVGDRVLVEKLSYRFRDVHRGDVIVFQRPDGSSLPSQADLPWYDDSLNFARSLIGLPTQGDTDYIKRVVAVGGD
ncbi:MAG: signal peptidase I, partial [Actinobacteria bacterium]|nr:signal peptidase I [Actinomycetota bacterium]